MFPDDNSQLPSVFVAANWFDSAIIIQQPPGKDTFVKTTTVEDVAKFITTGAWLTVQPENDFIPVQCIGFDTIQKIPPRDDMSRFGAFYTWKYGVAAIEPRLFVASRHEDYVVQATTTISQQELLKNLHPTVTEAIWNYLISS